MSKTKLEVITEALRQVGVIGQHEAADADTYARASAVYDSEFAKLDDVHEIGVSFTSNAVSDWAFVPMRDVIAGAICEGFSRPGFRSLYNRGLRDLRKYAANEAATDGRSPETVYF